MQSLLDRRPHTNSMVGSPIAGPWLPTHTSEERFWLGLGGGASVSPSTPCGTCVLSSETGQRPRVPFPFEGSGKPAPWLADPVVCSGQGRSKQSDS